MMLMLSNLWMMLGLGSGTGPNSYHQYVSNLLHFGLSWQDACAGRRACNEPIVNQTVLALLKNNTMAEFKNMVFEAVKRAIAAMGNEYIENTQSCQKIRRVYQGDMFCYQPDADGSVAPIYSNAMDRLLYGSANGDWERQLRRCVAVFLSLEKLTRSGGCEQATGQSRRFAERVKEFATCNGILNEYIGGEAQQTPYGFDLALTTELTNMLTTEVEDFDTP